MPADRRIFGPLDTDTAPEAVANGRSAALRNVQLERGYLTTVRGNELVGAGPLALPPGENVVVGACAAEQVAGGTGVVWLVYNSAGQHSLARWLPGSGADPLVLLTWPGLRLPARRGLTHACTLDGLLLYLDTEGAVRSVNLARAAAGEYSLARLRAEPLALHLVKAPPLAAPDVQRAYDGIFDADPRLRLRIIQTKAYQFACRWRYADGEQTVLSPYSLWLDVTSDPNQERYNYVSISLPLAWPGVKEVDVLVREPDSGAWLVADTLRRGADGALATNVRFFGLLSGGAVTTAEATTAFDNEWPGKALAIANGRLFKGNLTEGYGTPEPAFTADVVTGQVFSMGYLDVYELRCAVTFSSEPAYYFYALEAGIFGTADSTYRIVQRYDATQWEYYGREALTYEKAFGEADKGGETTPRQRTLVTYYEQPLRGTSSPETGENVPTLHENVTYRVAVQFYDNVGRPGGCSRSQSVQVPKRDYKSTDPLQPRSLRVTLTTTDAAGLQAEIPAWAHSCQFMVARNDRCVAFWQGVAADVLAYLGKERRVDKNNPAIPLSETYILKQSPVPTHGKLWVDIGNWPAAGMGYVWQPGSGDILHFLEDNQELVITGQYGDYVEVAWNKYPSTATPRIEIYSPNTTRRQVYYERGPRIAIVERQGQRRYARTSVVLPGDCFLTTLAFPVLDKTNYLPPDTKKYTDSPTGAVRLETMVPLFRIGGAGTTTHTTLVEEYYTRGIFGIKSDHHEETDGGTSTSTAPTGLPLYWLDMSYGGRPGAAVPAALQQVRRPSVIRFSGVKVPGTQLNGLAQWEALNEVVLPLEAGAVVALRLAAQGQTEGQTLVAVQERGAETLYLGQVPLSVATQQQQTGLVALSDAVVGGHNTLRGGFGTRHPGSVVGVGGCLFWWDADHGQLCRYAADGVNPLHTQHECRALGQELARRYAGAEVVAGYDPVSAEYVLCFGATEAAPARTERFSERAADGRGGFAGQVDYAPDALVGTGDTLYTLRGLDGLWRHSEQAARVSWYGLPAARAEVSGWCNAAATLSKTWRALVQEGAYPLWELIEARTPGGQRTRTPARRMARQEEKWVGPLLLDVHSPGFAPGPEGERRALYEGVPLQSPVLLVTLRCWDTMALVPRLVALSLDYTFTSGQTPAP